jgi:hypothetical protein
LDSGHDSAGTPAAAGKASADSVGASLAGDPQAAAAPHMAIMPTGKAEATATVNRSGQSATSSAPPAVSHPAMNQGSSPVSSGSSSPVSSGSAACAHPQYTTSDPNGMWNLAPYFVANDAWNASSYTVSQTVYGCSYSNWYVVATMDNSKGDGAVKTYPNSHRDFDSNPQISSFKSITSTFAETSPSTGIYEDAYDIWLNGIGGSQRTEVMIWTDNHGQSPGGDAQGTVAIDGKSYTAWRATTGTYIAFVANDNFTSGTMNLLAFFEWLTSKGWLSSSATLGQVDYGAELVSTNGVPATFTFSNFSVSAS